MIFINFSCFPNLFCAFLNFKDILVFLCLVLFKFLAIIIVFIPIFQTLSFEVLFNIVIVLMHVGWLHKLIFIIIFNFFRANISLNHFKFWAECGFKRQLLSRCTDILQIWILKVNLLFFLKYFLKIHRFNFLINL